MNSLSEGRTECEWVQWICEEFFFSLYHFSIDGWTFCRLWYYREWLRSEKKNWLKEWKYVLRVFRMTEKFMNFNADNIKYKQSLSCRGHELFSGGTFLSFLLPFSSSRQSAYLKVLYFLWCVLFFFSLIHFFELCAHPFHRNIRGPRFLLNSDYLLDFLDALN